MDCEQMCRVLLDQLEQSIQGLCIAQTLTEEMYLAAPQLHPVSAPTQNQNLDTQEKLD